MELYKVRLNGKEIPVREVRVSAVPFNKVWDGKQRDKAQTECGYYVSFDTAVPALLEITTSKPFDKYGIRPSRYAADSEQNGNTVKIHIDKHGQLTFEPFGLHFALQIFANPISEKPMGDVICFPKGEHIAGLIELRSNQTLYLEEGAVVHGMIYAQNAHDIKIMGRGVINTGMYSRGNDFENSGRELYDALSKLDRDDRESGAANPDNASYQCANMVLYKCKNVYAEGVIFEDSPFWSVIIRNGCENIILDNIKITGQWRYNSDGIDICASKNVSVKNCFVRSFDDCIIARGRHLSGETEDVENISVSNCVLWCDWGISLEIWNGRLPCEIRNVSFTDCYLIHISSIALDITTWYGSSESIVSNVTFRNIYIDGESEYSAPVIESETNPEYSARKGFLPLILKLSAQKIGKPTGNQGFEAASDYSEFMILYKNISLDNVRCTDPRLKANIIRFDEVLEIDNLSVKNCDFLPESNA